MSQVSIIDIEGKFPQIPTRFNADSGFAIPIGNILQIFGAGGITTSGSGNTITITGTPGVNSLTGNSGVATQSSNTINVITANSTPIFVGSGSTLKLDFGLGNLGLGSSFPSLTSGVQNVGFGLNTLNSITSGQQNVCVGAGCGALINTGTQNCGYGTGTLSNLLGGLSNCGYGQQCLEALTTGNSNIGFGTCLTKITTGSANTAIGFAAGSNYTGNDSSNISIVHPGLSSESNTIRIGQQGSGSGQQNRTFIAGITAVTVVASAAVAVDVNGQLSSLGFGTANQVLTSNGPGISPTWQTGVSAIDTLTGNSGGALTPTAGNLNILGAAVSAGTTPVTTVGSGSTITTNVQISQAFASSSSTRVGLAAFDSASFTVDANGFVQALGSGLGKTITGDSGGALSPTSGNWNILGGPGVTTSGSGSTLTINSVVFTDQGANVTAISDNGYFVTGNFAITLPASPLQGETVIIYADTSSVVSITANTGQIIRLGASVTTMGASITSGAAGDSITLRYRSSGAEWNAIASTGGWIF